MKHNNVQINKKKYKKSKYEICREVYEYSCHKIHK